MEGDSSKLEMKNYSKENADKLWDAYIDILNVFRDQFDYNIVNLDAGDQDKFFDFIKELREYWKRLNKKK